MGNIRRIIFLTFVFVVLSWRGVEAAQYNTKKTKQSQSTQKAQPAQQRQIAEEDSEVEDHYSSNYPQFTFDLSFAMGRAQNIDYSEAHLGLNAIFNSWFLWRNALFGRFMKETENLYGLDSTGRLYQFFGGSFLGLGIYGGLGYRFMKDNNAPISEAGTVFHLFNMINLGIGVKMLHNSVTQSGRKDEVQYSILLSGGGQL